jgi:hypothetical protein
MMHPDPGDGHPHDPGGARGRVRRLAMEALPWPSRDTPGPIRAIPARAGGYLAQPDMHRLIAAALELGWSL